MRYLGIDVHSKASVWCLLDAQGEPIEQGSTETTIPALRALVARLGKDDELLVGQEAGAMAYLVHDALAVAGVRLLTFNPVHLRMIAASRKKTDRRDAYWIARALRDRGEAVPPLHVAPQVLHQRPRQLLAHRGEQVGVVAEPHRQGALEREHPLAVPDGRQHVVHQERRALGPPPAHARRAEPAATTPEGHPQLVPASAAGRPHEPSREVATTCEPLQLGLHDPDAIVVFGIVSEWQGKCDPMDRICDMVELFPYSLWIDNNELDYGPGFDAATDLVRGLHPPVSWCVAAVAAR